MLVFGRAPHGSLLLLSLCAAWLCKASGEGYSLLSWLSSAVPENHDGSGLKSHVFQEWDASDVEGLPTVSEDVFEETHKRALKRKKKFKAPSFKAPSVKAPSTKKAKSPNKAPAVKAPSGKGAKAPSAPSAPGAGKGSKKAPSGKGGRRRRHRQ